MYGKQQHRLSRSSSAEPTELLAAIKKSLPTQLPPLDSHTIAKLKVGAQAGAQQAGLGPSTQLGLPPPSVRPAPAACRRRCSIGPPFMPAAAAIHRMYTIQEQALKKAADLQQQASHSAKQGLHGAHLVSSSSVVL